MKKVILSLALVVAILMAMVQFTITPALAASITFSSGSGTESDPYIITTAEQLANLATEVNSGNSPYYNKAYKLGNDIDLSNYGKNWNNGKGWIPIGNLGHSFRGSFDGDNNIIIGLYINDDSGMSLGLFGEIEETATVKNIGIIDISISSNKTEPGRGIGGVVGRCDGTVINCYSTGKISGISNVGGLIGDSMGANVINSYSDCDITGSYIAIGGIAGAFSNGGSVTDCYFTGTVTCTEAETFRTGGIAGWLGGTTEGSGAKIVNCYTTGTISGGDWVGGIAGVAIYGSTIENCYATEKVSGNESVGGVVGVASVSTVTNCAALNPSVKGSNQVGRVVGFSYNSALVNNRAYSGMHTDGGMAFIGTSAHDGLDGADFHSNDPSKLNREPQTVSPNLDDAATWAQSGIQSAVDKGFVPADLRDNYTSVITRAEFCRMAVKWVEYRTGKTIDAVLADKGVTRNANAFSDTNDEYILAAFALGITNGTGDGTFNPNGEFSREQAATMIMNTCKVVGMDADSPPTADFTDLNAASNWAVNGINFVRANGIMSGTSTDPTKPTFSPKGTYTRQESIVTFNNIK